MKSKYLKYLVVLVFFLLPLLGISAQDVNLTGDWMLSRVTIEKDSSGIRSVVPYEVSEGNIPMWDIYTSLEFTGDGQCFLLLNGEIIKGDYSIENNSIELDFIIMLPTYNYTLEGDLLHLSRRHYLGGKSRPERGHLEIDMYYERKTGGL